MTILQLKKTFIVGIYTLKFLISYWASSILDYNLRCGQTHRNKSSTWYSMIRLFMDIETRFVDSLHFIGVGKD